jgi:hypothetical protein
VGLDLTRAVTFNAGVPGEERGRSGERAARGWEGWLHRQLGSSSLFFWPYFEQRSDGRRLTAWHPSVVSLFSPQTLRRFRRALACVIGRMG